jgi:glycosyltransferase involved in cell wall biosynthesis
MNILRVAIERVIRYFVAKLRGFVSWFRDKTPNADGRQRLQQRPVSRVEPPITPASASGFTLPDAANAPRADMGVGFLLSDRDRSVPLPGVSLVAACMNREENLMKVVRSWLATRADEIIVVDWSSTSEIGPALHALGNPRLKVIRIDGEAHWILTHALNVGLRSAAHEVVFKVDCDIELAPDFMEKNAPRPGEFVRGFWKSGLEQRGEGQQYINGNFGAYKTDLRAANYFDERIQTYGWDDSDLYHRLSHDLGLAGRQIDPFTLTHLEQVEGTRSAHQALTTNRFLGRFAPTEFEGAKNKYSAALSGNWAPYYPSQDYRLSATGDRSWQGHRVTQTIARDADIDYVAELFAARQLGNWAASVPEIGPMPAWNLAFSQLLRDAHAIGKTFELIDGIKRGTGVYFFRCESSPLCAAVLKTLRVLRLHHAPFVQGVVLVEGEPAHSLEGPAAAGGNILICPGGLIEELAGRAHAAALGGIEELETLLESGDGRAALLAVSARSVAADVFRKTAQVRGAVGNAFEAPAAPLTHAYLVTSLYDEHNLGRLVEYLACVVGNLDVFGQVAICYEAENGLLAAIVRVISAELNIAPGRLLLLPYQTRPTFETLFSVKTFLPDATVLVVANADVMFDASFAKVEQTDLSKTLWILSRRDVSREGTQASLIRLENGCPNTFSADAWIARTPFEPDFRLDYLIGTMHCDSFINHQIGTSSRYEATNPCFDIRVLHVHDERFNSSAEKSARDWEAITRNREAERVRAGGEDPIKGMAWSTLATAGLVPQALRLQQWRPRAVVFDLAQEAAPGFGHFLLLRRVHELIQPSGDTLLVVKLNERDLHGTLGQLLARYQTHFSFNNLLLDASDAPFDPIKARSAGAITRALSFQAAADLVVKGSVEDLRAAVDTLLAWEEGFKVIRGDLHGPISADTTFALLESIGLDQSGTGSWLHEFFESLPAWGPERNMLIPYVIPQLHANQPQPARSKRGRGSLPRVSFVTSLFNGGAFLPGYLENVLMAALEADGEVIIVDANADDRDRRVVTDFMRSHRDASECIDYVRLEKDPGLYECWKLAIERARAGLITNANIDDRRSPQHTAQLVRRLEANPEYGGACGSIAAVSRDGTGDWYTLEDNQIWFFGEGSRAIGFEDLYRIDERGEIRSRNKMHCMPVWRKSLHQRHGYFDEEKYGTSADWAFWLKCAKAGERFYFDQDVFGRYFLNPSSHNRRNDVDGKKELRIIEDWLGRKQDGITKQ